MTADQPGVDDPRRVELLHRVREVCRLHWAKRGHDDVDAKEYETGPPGQRLTFIRVSYVDDNFTEHALVGVHDGIVDNPTVRRYAELFADHSDVRSPPDLIYGGGYPTRYAEHVAKRLGVRLRSFESYQRALWNHARYLEKQTDDLAKDPLYPLDRHVDKRWAILGQREREADAAAQIRRWLDTEGPRFVLVLGNSGTGKTFLIRVLARELATHPDLVPVLVTMRDLERRRTLEELIALHMARNRPDDSFHYPSFRYLLREGRIVLLFDGFDELAQRPTYDRVKQHFNTLRQAADGNAKIVVTSRHEHFATDTDVLNELGLDARNIPGARIIRLFPLDEHQRRDLVEQTIEGVEAVAFLRDLESVPNLPELAANPRMLTFVMERRESLSRLAGSASATEPLTAGRLYEILLTDWLTHEQRRQTAAGAADPLTVDQRCAALRQLAVLLWRSGRASIPLTELGELAESITDLAAWQVQSGEAAHAVGSGTVLVRTESDQFAFIHQSVLEWFVADTLRTTPTGADPLLAEHPLTPAMADFFIDLAYDQAAGWAEDVLGGQDESGPKTKANATLILQRVVARLPMTPRFVVTDLSGQDLRGRDLSRAVLSGADLSGAQLDGAVLSGADLTGADLSGASLQGTRLDRADLTGADLSGASLQGARLLGADLTGADLAGANLDRALLIGATLDPHALNTATTYGTALPDATPTPQHETTAPVQAAVSLGNGTLLATGHADGTIRIRDVVSGLALRTLIAHTGPVWALAADPGGSWLASAGIDGRVRIWDPTTGTQLRSLEGHFGPVHALAVGSAGSWLVSAGTDSVVRIWDPRSGAQLRSLDARVRPVYALAVAPDGSWLAAACADGQVRLWDPATGMSGWSVEARSVSALAAGPAGDWVASADADGSVRIWDPTSGKLLRSLEGHSGQLSALAVDPGGSWLASAGAEGVVRIWDPTDGTQLHALEGNPGWVHALAVDPGGAWLATTGANRVVEIWDPSSGTYLRRLGEPSRVVSALAADPAGAWVASGDAEGDVRIWDPNTGANLAGYLGSVGRVSALAADPGGSWVASADELGAVRMRNMATDEFRSPFPRHDAAVFALAMDPAGSWLASAGADATVRVWDPSDGKSLRTLVDHTGAVRALVAGPDGASLVSVDAANVMRIWNVRTGKRLRRIKGDKNSRANALTGDRHGAWIAAAGSDRTVRIWHLRRGLFFRRFRRSPSVELHGHTAVVQALAAGPGGQLVSAGADRTVRIWNPITGVQLHTLAGHAGSVRAVAVDSRGEWLASGGNDGTVRMWGLASGELRMTLVGDEGGWAVLWPDGGYRVEGAPRGVWWAAGLCRIEAEEIDEIAGYVAGLRRVEP